MDIGRTMIPNHLPRKRYVVKAFPLVTVFFTANLCFATLRCKKKKIEKVGLLEFSYSKWSNQIIIQRIFRNDVNIADTYMKTKYEQCQNLSSDNSSMCSVEEATWLSG